MNPPSHGGFFATTGLPWKYTVIAFVAPARCASASVTKNAFPSRR